MGTVLKGAVLLCSYLKRHSVQMLLMTMLYYNTTDTIPCASKYWEHAYYQGIARIFEARDKQTKCPPQIEIMNLKNHN